MAPPSTEGDRSSATGEAEEDVEVLRMARPAFELLENFFFSGRKDRRQKASAPFSVADDGADSASAHGQQA